MTIRWKSNLRPGSIITRAEVTTDPFNTADYVSRVGVVERRLLHVSVDLEAEVEEASRRSRYHPKIVTEAPDCPRVRLVPEKTVDVLLRRLRVVLLDIRPDHPVLACSTAQPTFVMSSSYVT